MGLSRHRQGIDVGVVGLALKKEKDPFAFVVAVGEMSSNAKAKLVLYRPNTHKSGCLQ